MGFRTFDVDLDSAVATTLLILSNRHQREMRVLLDVIYNIQVRTGCTDWYAGGPEKPIISGQYPFGDWRGDQVSGSAQSPG
jgi:hypothetical protein